ncbi:hypothetical protein ACMA1D_11780 [Streptomyces sp. 796.1]|uniref:hypothetical protein n=1 Tax=Streptomyces sp. 796.1 TaxID=3163029 RepID=UPI0039C95FEC
MTLGRLSPEVPLGPFATSRITVWSTPGNKAKLHASARCSQVRTGNLTASELPLSTAVQQMCPRCAESSQWARPGTGLGLFLEALTGLGLLSELDHYAGPDEDTRTEEDVQQTAALLNRPPQDVSEEDLDEPAEEDEEDWHTMQAARQERTTVVGQWREAVASLHRTFEMLAPFPWLRPWASPSLEQKTSYIALLQQQSRQLLLRDALVVAACAGTMDTPELLSDAPALTALGPATKVTSDLISLWERWRGHAADSWEHPREGAHLAYHLADGMRRRRKGRDAVLEHSRQLVSAWTAEAEAAASGPWEERVLVARLPEWFTRRQSEPRESYPRSLSEWELGVLVTWGTEADWERLTVTLRVPEPIAVRLLSPDSNLSCRTPEEAAAEPVTVPEQSVEPGVFDDGPVSERRPVTAGHLRALRAISKEADQLYLVLSLANGSEVISLSVLEQRVHAGGRYVIIAAADGLPGGILPEQHEQSTGADSSEGGSIWLPRIHDAEDPDFARDLSATEGERVVARLMRGSRWEADAALRSLSLARGVPDLRVWEGARDERGHRNGPFPYDVWHGLLAMETLDLAPFRPVSEDSAHGGSGLPLGVLARVQLYTTDAAGRYQGRAHSPDCDHRRGDGGLTRQYDLVTVEEMMHAEQFDPCSKCGGYATRRLTEVQVAYYRAAHRVHEIARRVRWATGNRDLAGDCAPLVDKVKTWCDKNTVDKWFETREHTAQWRQVMRELSRTAQQLQ